MTSRVDEHGVRYLITGAGRAFATKLTTEYHADFKQRVLWVEKNIGYLAAERRSIYKIDRVV
ncbi:hypothetical protein D3C84_1106320 [compost metagenome]|jgi:hypothetical protein